MQKTKSLDDIEDFLQYVSFEPCDVIYLGTDLLKINCLQYQPSPTIATKKIVGFVRSVLRNKTVVFPTSTLNFSVGGLVFDARNTPSHKVGYINEYLRANYCEYRSAHPLWSYAAFGPLSKDLLANTSWNAYGFNSLWSRLLKYNVLCVNLGVDLRDSMPVVHHLEQCFGVPYRRVKLFQYDVVDFEGVQSNGNYCINVIPREIEIIRDRNSKLLRDFDINSKSFSIFSDLQCYQYVDLYNHLYGCFEEDMFCWIRNVASVQELLVNNNDW